jgi:hypothetical protein
LSSSLERRRRAMSLSSMETDSQSLAGSTECRSHEPFDILSARVQEADRRGSARTRLNKCVGTKWVLVPATYSPPRGSTELEFRIRDWVVGQERRVSRVLCRGDQSTQLEYETTPNDTTRLSTAAYFLRTGTPDLQSARVRPEK